MKRGNVVFVLIALLFLVGCQRGNTDDQQGQGAFVGGDAGLQIAFAENEPPEVVLDNNQESFFITLLLKNQGEYTIPKNGLIASVSGVSKDAFSIPSLNKKNDIEIIGTKKENS